ncbi:MAG: hypothetical protein IAF38_17685, partial [Bacteroidia bacterium]|nr:hypothetical protein [Bacteroidia bacterium]
MRKISLFLFLPLFCGIFFSCKKDKLITDSDAKLGFSQDTIMFDTIFTTIGSTTKYFTVHNDNNQRINISNIRLARGNASPYRLNVDGTPTKSINDVEIEAHDSIYIFVEVTVDPITFVNPLVTDSILFETNGNMQDVDLISFAKDAYFHLPNHKIIFSNGGVLYYGLEHNSSVYNNWPADKPHVVYGYYVVDSAKTLNVEAGTNVYIHQNGGLWVYRYGTIKVNGTLAQPVTFQGDRLEAEYADVPGQWDRIWINEGSTGNLIDYAIIKNGFIGIQHDIIAGNLSEPRKLTVNNTIVKNMSGWGLFAYHGNIEGNNNLVCNCAKNVAAFLYGGKFKFYHCTFANFWNKSDRGDPVLYMNNYEGSFSIPLDTVYFGNCIIDGANGEEFALDTLATGGVCNHVFENTLIKTNVNISGTRFISCWQNQPPNYEDAINYNFKLNTGAFP